MGSEVGYEVVEGVAHVTIDRPDKRNAMNLEVFAQLAERAAAVQADDDVRAVVVAGRDGNFSAGIDLVTLERLLGDGLEPTFVARLQATFTAYEELDVPVVAAIEGHCLGAGVQLAAACHLRAVAPDASLAVMESRWGLIPDLGGTHRLPRLIGPGRTTELAMTARRFDAEEARRIGFAEIALPGEDAQGAAHTLAARLAAGPGSVRQLPRLIRENLDRDRAGALAAEIVAQEAAVTGPDVAEAIAAHRAGRQPRFVAR
ncbi:MAG: enoyl-CoA hydratase-related protein [Nitriliruptoraceae bacterium]